MSVTTMEFMKLDEGLAQIIHRGVIRASELVPVIISTSSNDGLQAVCDVVSQSGGTVRHILKRIGAVAAWLPVSSMEGLTSLDQVTSVELDQHVIIAGS